MPEDADLLARLRAGDEAAFETLVSRHHAGLRRLARTFVSSDASADEVVQETWMAVLDNLHTFEGRSSLKTWIYRILANRSRTRGVREARSVPASSLGDGDDHVAAVAGDRFDGRGHWSRPPASWETGSPAELLAQRETMQVLEDALASLPERQRQVVLLRDALAWSADEVCNVLDLTETNQRVLLHRGRARLREILEQHLEAR